MIRVHGCTRVMYRLRFSHVFMLLLLSTGFLWTSLLIPVQAQPPSWSGDTNLAFLMRINNVSIAESNVTSPILVGPADDLVIQLQILTGADIVLKIGRFVITYMSISIVDQIFPFNIPLMNGTFQSLGNQTLPLGSLLGGIGGSSLLSGTLTGYFAFVYSLQSTPLTNITVSDDFVLQLGPIGLGALGSVSGMLTLGFTIMSVFGLLLSLDDFQQGILAARKMRSGKTPAEIGIFPPAVLLRRSKKESEKISTDELTRQVSAAASKVWDGRRCPRCGKKWPKDSPSCVKCKIERDSAVKFFSDNIAEYAPKAIRAVPVKSKITVRRFSKRIGLTPQKGGALAAALTEIGVFQTKSVKIPLKKVSLSGMTLANMYWSWMQLLGRATPTILDMLFSTTIGLVASVLIAYFMAWLARVPPMGYKQ